MRRLVIFLLVLLWLPAPALQLAWDASDTGATGYRLLYGTNSGVYEVSINVGTNLTVAVIGLTPGRTYFFAATAYNSTATSVPSEELAYTAPITNTVLTVDHAGQITGPWTNVVTLTNVVEAAGFWRVNITKTTNTP